MTKRVFLALLLSVLPFYETAAGDGLWDEEPVSETKPAEVHDIMELPVSLKDKAVVDGDYILLGDLFGGLDEAAEGKAVAPSPALGKEVDLTADWLNRLARRHGIRWEAKNENVKITVRRAANEVGKDELLKAFADSLHAAGMPEREGPSPLLPPNIGASSSSSAPSPSNRPALLASLPPLRRDMSGSILFSPNRELEAENIDEISFDVPEGAPSCREPRAASAASPNPAMRRFSPSSSMPSPLPVMPSESLSVLEGPSRSGSNA